MTHRLIITFNDEVSKATAAIGTCSCGNWIYRVTETVGEIHAILGAKHAEHVAPLTEEQYVLCAHGEKILTGPEGADELKETGIHPGCVRLYNLDLEDEAKQWEFDRWKEWYDQQ